MASGTPVSGAPGLDIAGIQAMLGEALAPHYEVVRPLGQGGMGFVFLARETALRRLVAVKVLAPRLAEDAAARARFEREARAAAALSHPNVVQVFTVGETAEPALPYIVMQHVDGPTVAARTKEAGAVPEREARRIVADVAFALAGAHQHGLVHRDIKPSNVLIERASGRALVTDFGLTAAVATPLDSDEARLTTTGMILGTPAYMSPEQAAGERVGPPSDVYSLGVLAYELLTGKLPFTAATSIGWAAAHLRDSPALFTDGQRDVSPAFATLVARCLAKAPDARPAARDIADALRAASDAEPSWPPPGATRLRLSVRRLMRAMAAAAVCGLILIGLLASPPETVRVDREQWWQPFATAAPVPESALGVQTDAPSRVPSPPRGWHAMMWLTWGVLGASLALTLVFAAAAATQATRARRVGWRWRTLADAAADPDGRSGLLVAGAGDCASLPAASRAAALRARRLQAATRLGAAVWAAVCAGLWAAWTVLGARSLDGAGPLASAGAVLLVLVPATALHVAAARARRRERRALEPLSLRRPHSAATPRIDHADADAVAAWYAQLPGEMTPAPRQRVWRRNFLVAGVALVAGAGLVVGWGALGQLIAANVVAGNVVRGVGPETATLAVALAGRGDADPHAAAQQAVAPYLPPSSEIGPDGVGRLIDELSGTELPAYPIDPAEVVRELRARDEEASLTVILRETATLDGDAVQRLAAAGAHPRTAALRSLAAVREANLLGAVLDRPLAEYGTLADLPELPYVELRQTTQANALGAVAALASRGDRVEAAARFGENAAVALHLLAAPKPFANRFGAGMLQEFALLPLAEIETLRGDTARAALLRRVAHDLREQAYAPARRAGLIGLAANPERFESFRSALAPGVLLPGERVDGQVTGHMGFCGNSREIIGGSSSVREEELRAIADGLSEDRDAHARELGVLAARTPRAGPSADRGGPWFLYVVGWPSASVASRLRQCVRVAG